MSSRIPVFKEPNSVLRDLNSSNTGARSTSLEPEKLWSPIHLPNEHKLLNTFCTQSDEYLSKNRLEVERLHIEKQLIDLHKHLRNKENEIKNIKINADYWEKLQNLFLNNPKPIYLGSSNSPDCVDIRKSLSPEHILYYVQTTLQQEVLQVLLLPPDQSIPIPLSSSSVTHMSSQAIQTDLSSQIDDSIPLAVYTQTENDLLLPFGSTHLQQRLEAMKISKELLQSSLENAQRQIESLEKIIVSQKEEMNKKESQLSTISNRVSVLMRSFESTHSDSLQYKALYYRSVQQCSSLQELVNHFENLLNKVNTVFQLQGVASNNISSKKRMLQQWQQHLYRSESLFRQQTQELLLMKSEHEQLEKEKKGIIDKTATLKLSCSNLEKMVGKQLSIAVIMSAKDKIREGELTSLEKCLFQYKNENKELHRKIAQLMDRFQRSHNEYSENAEFVEIERQMLLEANKELEAEVKGLKDELQKGENEFKKVVNSFKDYQLKSNQKVETLKCNIDKADKEIKELDKLFENVRQVLHDNRSSIKDCKPLISLLKKLSGDHKK